MERVKDDSSNPDPLLPFGSRYCRCATCGRHFGGERAFDQHRVGPLTERVCLPPSGIREAALSLSASGYRRRAYCEAA